jgi:hypothetical protein
VATEVLPRPTNSFGIDGYQAMLVGQRVPHAKSYTASAAEAAKWRAYRKSMDREAAHGLAVSDCLDFLRQNTIS